MSNLSTLKGILEADGTLMGYATGGGYDWDETGRLGINRSNAATSTAFTGSIIKPCWLLKLRTSLPFGGIADDPEQKQSMRDMFELLFYEHNGFTNIELMKNRAYRLLHGTRPTGTASCRHAGDYNPPRDIELDAYFVRSDYAVIWIKS